MLSTHTVVIPNTVTGPIHPAAAGAAGAWSSSTSCSSRCQPKRRWADTLTPTFVNQANVSNSVQVRESSLPFLGLEPEKASALVAALTPALGALSSARGRSISASISSPSSGCGTSRPSRCCVAHAKVVVVVVRANLHRTHSTRCPVSGRHTHTKLENYGSVDLDIGVWTLMHNVTHPHSSLQPRPRARLRSSRRVGWR